MKPERRTIEVFAIDDIDFDRELERQDLGQGNSQLAASSHPDESLSVQLDHFHVPHAELQSLGEVADLVGEVILEKDHPIPWHKLVVDPKRRGRRLRRLRARVTRVHGHADDQRETSLGKHCRQGMLFHAEPSNSGYAGGTYRSPLLVAHTRGLARQPGSSVKC